MFFEIVILNNFAILTRKTPVFESLLNKVARLEACHFIRKRLQYRCFPVNIAKFLRTVFLKNTSGGCFCAIYSSGFYDIYKSGN